MSLKTIVKLSRVTNLTDARYAAGMGVQFIGFAFDGFEAANAELLTQRTEISQWISGPEIVVEDEGLNAEQMQSLLGVLPASYIQTRNLDLVNGLGLIYPLPKSADAELEIEKIKGLFPEALFLLELNASELSEQEIADLQVLCDHYQIILKSNSGSEALLELVEQVSPFGIEIMGGDEERPGYKDLSDIMDVLEALEVED